MAFTAPPAWSMCEPVSKTTSAVDIVDHHGRARLGEFHRHGAPDAATGAGHERGAAFEVERHACCITHRSGVSPR
jgi:hypothetical protein